MEGQPMNVVRLDGSEREESIEEIVLRLPPAAVARFKCVSKGWWQRLSGPSFAERYQARNVRLLGFFHQIIHRAFQFTAIPSSFCPEISTGELSPSGTVFQGGIDHTDAVLNSSNGLILIYTTKPTPCYVVSNPIAGGDKTVVRFPARFPCKVHSIGQRFMVFGFAFNPYCANPFFTIVEVTVDGSYVDRFRIFRYTSLSPKWDATSYHIPTRLRRNFALSGPSTFYRDSLHWLLEPSGVVAYHVVGKTFSFALINIPGDDRYLDDNGFCNCVKKMRGGGLYSSGHCSCRHLGESRDKLIYVRVTADRQFSLWTLVNYYRGVWSLTGLVTVDNIPESLFFGCVLAYDRMDSNLLFMRVKKDIFAYHCLSRELKKLSQIPKEYGGDANCLGFVVPYELPKITFCIPNHTPPGPLSSEARSFTAMFSFLKRLCLDPLAVTEDMFSRIEGKLLVKEAREFLSRWKKDDDHLHLYQKFGISQVVAKYLPHLQPSEVDATGPPIWSSYNFCAPFTMDGCHDTIVNYNNIVRIEASLYGCTAERWGSADRMLAEPATAVQSL